jgi:hypothetical protein
MSDEVVMMEDERIEVFFFVLYFSTFSYSSRES